ncbi:MAG: thiol reductase thioredoxin [Myxococcales bacterium]|nr:thiol reductase thioredoxin [Myxococcales bacterium]
MAHLHFRCRSCGQLSRVPADKRNAGAKCGRCKTALDVSGAPQVVDDAQLSRLVDKSPVPVLVDFYADWCGPCRTLSPVLANLGAERAGELIVVKVDTESDQSWARRVGVRGIPAVHLFSGGRAIASETGARPLGFWRDWLRRSGH